MSPADRELLALAAKAAGLTLEWQDSKGVDSPLPWCVEEARYWNPREDDGDAFRLQTVAVGMALIYWYDNSKRSACEAKGGVYLGHEELCIKKDAIIK